MSAFLRADSTACMATGVCVSLAPDHLDVVDGVATWVGDHPLSNELADEVVDSCPMAALERL